MDRAQAPIDSADREALIQWTMEAKLHTADPESLDTEYLTLDHPLDYHMLTVIFQQHSDLVRDFD